MNTTESLKNHLEKLFSIVVKLRDEAISIYEEGKQRAKEKTHSKEDDEKNFSIDPSEDKKKISIARRLQ